jgi:hypothetical protein
MSDSVEGKGGGGGGSMAVLVYVNASGVNRMGKACVFGGLNSNLDALVTLSRLSLIN